MTKAPRGPGAPIQLKDSRETLVSNPVSMTEKRAAQLVVCQYVDAWYSHLDEVGKMAEVNELFDILGIGNTPDIPAKAMSWKELKR